MDNKTFHQREAIAATVRDVVVDLAEACEVMYQKGYTLACTKPKRDDMTALRAFHEALIAGDYENPAIDDGINVLVIRGASEDFMKDVYSFLGIVEPKGSVEWDDGISIADNIKANINSDTVEAIPAEDNDTVKNTISIYDAETKAEFIQGAKNLAHDIANQQSYPDIVDALLEDGIESVSEVFQQCWDNYTCYSPFEMVMSAINKLGEDESGACWDAIQGAIQEVFESVAGEVLKGVNSEIQERIEEYADAYELSDDDYDEVIDQTSDEVRVGNRTFSPSDALKHLDPLAYKVGKQECQDMMLEDNEEYQELVDLLSKVKI